MKHRVTLRAERYGEHTKLVYDQGSAYIDVVHSASPQGPVNWYLQILALHEKWSNENGSR